MAARVKVLLGLPQPAQRTPAWFAARKYRVTASEVASVLHITQTVCDCYNTNLSLHGGSHELKMTPGAKPQLCNPYGTIAEFFKRKLHKAAYNDSAFTVWGKMYEPIALSLYQGINNVDTVHDFGLLTHQNYDWLAASPDGISSEGIVLEIKCPLKRKIVPGYVPLYYWIQVQIQLEVCDLEDCHFWQVQIKELKKDTFFKRVADVSTGPFVKYKYGVIQKPDRPDVTDNLESYWIESEIDNESNVIEKLKKGPKIYFTIEKYDLTVVRRDPVWFESVKDRLFFTSEVVKSMKDAETEEVDPGKEEFLNDVCDI